MTSQTLGDRLDQIDVDIHNLHNLAGITVYFFDNLNSEGKDDDGFTIRRFTGQQLNQFWFLLTEMHNRANRLHHEYLEACKMIGGDK